MSESSFWRKCSFCKSEINFGADYYRCSVTTCNQRSTDYVFCSVPCFEAHVPGARHKDAGAVHERAPRFAQPPQVIENKIPANAETQATATSEEAVPENKTGRRFIATSQNRASHPPLAHEREILIVASKLKDYIRAAAGFNTSAEVMQVLSDIVRGECQKAIDNARADGRKTVMARDFRK